MFRGLSHHKSKNHKTIQTLQINENLDISFPPSKAWQRISAPLEIKREARGKAILGSSKGSRSFNIKMALGCSDYEEFSFHRINFSFKLLKKKKYSVLSRSFGIYKINTGNLILIFSKSNSKPILCKGH